MTLLSDEEGDIEKNLSITTLVLGIVAGALTTFAFLPAVIRCYKNKEQSPNNIWVLILSLVGNITWVVYSSMVKDYILTAYASVSVLFFAMLLISLGVFKKRATYN